MSGADGNSHISKLTLADFDYPFPDHLVAQEPHPERDQAKLLVRAAQGQLRHRRVCDLTSELEPGTLLILNDSRVFPSRLSGRLSSGGHVELFLVRACEGEPRSSRWLALAKPLKKLPVGRTIFFDGDVEATVLARHDSGGTATVEVAFSLAGEELSRWLDHHGLIPLPPYIARPDAKPAPLSRDRDRYQTVYANERGSVAAPTAGLHFSETLLTSLREKGVELATVALHVGAGTFLPVKTENLTDHRMHAETYRIPLATMRALLAAKAERRPVIAVGTTTLRTLEAMHRRSAGDTNAMLAQADVWHSTDIFIYPKTADDRVRPWAIDGLITNFHQPRSTLFMLIAALIGLDAAKKMYAAAIAAEYRLYSYGDTSLLWL